MRREEEERRERYVAGVTALYNRERDIALASYDGEAAAGAILALAEAIHGANTAATAASWSRRRRRSTSTAAIAAATCISSLRSRCGREKLALASSDDERGAAPPVSALRLRLGGRESGTARLEEAVRPFARR